MSEHAKEHEPKITGIERQLMRLGTADHTAKLLGIVRRPGFTTPQEAQFVHALLDTITHHLQGVEQAQRRLLEIADQIGRESQSEAQAASGRA